MKHALLAALLGAALTSACGFGGGAPAMAITVTVMTSASIVQAGGTAQVTATVANDSANKGVTWSVTCSAAQCGLVSPTSTASGVATTYTAPATPPTSNLTVTITATSVADPSKSASVIIMVPAVTVSVAPSSATVPPAGTQQFTATVMNTSNTSVTWTLTQGGTACSPTCGTLNSTTANPVTYTAPAMVPTPPTVTISATSAADPTKSVSTSILVSSTLSVSLTWDAPVPSPVGIAGYNLYRGITSGGENLKVNPSLLPPAPPPGCAGTGGCFLDTTVQPGITYFYVVKSVGINGVESLPSNEVRKP